MISLAISVVLIAAVIINFRKLEENLQHLLREKRRLLYEQC